MTFDPQTLAAVSDALFSARRAAICAHVCPDGDAVGSALAMRAALLSRGVDAHVLLPGAIGAEYDFLPDVLQIRYPENVQEDDFDLIVCVDCADRGRMGVLEPLAQKQGRNVVVIDHHVTNEGFGTVNLVQSDSAATGEILTHLFSALDIAITPEMALCLYTAISTDTGGFAFSNTRPATLRAAAALVESGADAALVYRKIYAARRLSKTLLIGRALVSIKSECDGAVITGVLTAQDFAECGAPASDSDGVIDFLRDVQTCKVCALVRDFADGSKISFRCADGFDVSSVAARFGGGGHKNAAGCSLDIPACEAEVIIRQALCAYLQQVHA